MSSWFTNGSEATERVVVVDTETTGLGADDRIVEIACVTLDRTGHVIDEWDTLVNPGRDCGPTHIHGVTASMVADAPTFAEVLAALATQLHGAVLAAHNLPFDQRMLAGELDRVHTPFDLGMGFDTLSVTRCRLPVACERQGITHVGAHRALNDARVTAELLVSVADRFVDLVTAPASLVFDGPASYPRTWRDDAGRVLHDVAV